MDVANGIREKPGCGEVPVTVEALNLKWVDLIFLKPNMARPEASFPVWQ